MQHGRMRCSRNLRIDAMTRCPARSLRTKILQSSAYRTNRSPRLASSPSISLSTILDSNGESGPPCGVPSWTATFVPSGITTAAFSIRCMRLTIRWSVTRLAIRANRR
jgi:hypothetical protein